jgi:hypothetical protein
VASRGRATWRSSTSERRSPRFPTTTANIRTICSSASPADSPQSPPSTASPAALPIGGDARLRPGRAIAPSSDRTISGTSISYTIFLRRQLLERVGGFDECLGLGAPGPWSSGEEIELLVRAVRAGGRIAYDPSLVVHHELRSYADADLRALGYRDGASVGYILRRHGYGRRTVGRMFVRPLGGVVAALADRDIARAGVHVATLSGRLRGYYSG